MDRPDESGRELLGALALGGGGPALGGLALGHGRRLGGGRGGDDQHDRLRVGYQGGALGQLQVTGGDVGADLQALDIMVENYANTGQLKAAQAKYGLPNPEDFTK